MPFESLRNRNNLEEPCDKGPVEPVAALLASVQTPLLRLVRQESLLLAINLVLACVEVGLVRLDTLGLHDELVSEDADQVDRNTLDTMSAERSSDFER